MTAVEYISPDFTKGVLRGVRDNMKNTAHLCKTIEASRIPRETFDPTDKDHLAAYDTFLRTGKWTRHFYNEWPSLDVPTTINKKIVAHFLKHTVEPAGRDPFNEFLGCLEHGIQKCDACLTA